jgi:hypothetical protein
MSGKSISFAAARALALQVLLDAEKAREETAEREARPLIQHDNELIAEYLEDVVAKMRKRVWIPGDENDFFELPDGAVPVWWLREEVKRLMSGEQQ